MNMLKGLFDILQDFLSQNNKKLEISRVQSKFQRPNVNLIFLKTIFLSEYTWSSFCKKKYSISFVPETINFVKMCLIFYGFQSKALTRYQKILRGCSFGFKNLLNFTAPLWVSTNVTILIWIAPIDCAQDVLL